MTLNKKKLIFCHIAIVFMALTFLYPVTRPLWNAIDIFFFKTLNTTLIDNPSLQLFWALANHKHADWVHDIVFLAFFIAAAFSVPREDRLKKTAQLIFYALYIGCTIVVANELIFRGALHIRRDSPTLSIPDSFRLSQHLRWLKIKDCSNKSFPGDHATTALLLATSFAYCANRRLAIIGWCYGIFMCLPRMIAGAHWFSDVVIGSGSIVLLFLGWAFFSPLGSKATDLIHRCLLLRKGKASC